MLSNNAIMEIYQNNTNIQPTLQVTDLKKIGNQNGQGQERWRYQHSFFYDLSENSRVVLSDGKHYMQALLASQVTEKVRSDSIKKFCVVRLDEFVCNLVHNKRLRGSNGI